MARIIPDLPNAVAPDSDYPYGRIKNNTGGNNGTPVNEFTNGDFHQFFARMMDIAGITPNGLPDNESSGFQLFEALVGVIAEYYSKGFYDQNNERWETRVYNIGPWNMNTQSSPPSTTFFAGLDYSKMKNIQILIYDDGEDFAYPLNHVDIVLPGLTAGDPAGQWLLNKGGGSGPFFNLNRFAGGFFQSTDFDDATMNRGIITFDYKID